MKKRTFLSSEKETLPLKKAEKATAPLPLKVSKDLKPLGKTCQTRIENESTITILKTLVKVIKHQVMSLSGLRDTIQQLRDEIAQ
ncbi:hypothetical protein Bpfe_023478 [Biomphalaria pfeifferi]|uniref:Uncharacterized protein n=1 Tax=Biomphalaria pfeifferi TaxID=112525 RepID=A0AAD8F0T5_BIOPF|nr:hypothetical protein Bpfe_023478 [Biomphalaria pfeifferi]